MGLLRVLCLMLLTVTSILGQDADNTCPDNWHLFTDTCVKIYNESTSWINASAICSQDGGHLLKVPDNTSQSKLHKLIVGKSVYTVLWMGASRNDNESNFTWTDESEVTFTNWLGTSTIDNCGALSLTHDWAWITDNCSHSSWPFICQKISNSSGKNSVVRPMVMKNKTVSTNNSLSVYIQLVVISSKPVENLIYFLNNKTVDNTSIVDFQAMKAATLPKDGISFVYDKSIGGYLNGIKLYLNLSKVDAETEVRIRMNSRGRSLDYVFPQDVITILKPKEEENSILPVIGAIIGILALAVIIGLIVIVSRRKRGKEGRKVSEDKPGENRQDNGRTVTADGLVYVTVDVAKNPNSSSTEKQPTNKRAQEKVEYVSVEFEKSGKESGRTVTEDGLVYVSVDHSSKPNTAHRDENPTKKPKEEKVEYVSVDFQKSGKGNGQIDD